MADWKLEFPELFQDREIFRAFVQAQVKDAIDSFFVGMALTMEQRAAIAAFGEWLVVGVGLGIYVNSKTKGKLEAWTAVMKEQHAEIQNKRIEWHLKSILRASNEPEA